MSDRPTPETDYEQKIDNGDTWPLFEFARRLERERDEARETLARLRQDLADPPADVQEAVIDKLCLRSVITERNEAREQLDRICRDGFGYQDTIGLEPCADYVLRKLNEERELARELRDMLQLASDLLESAGREDGTTWEPGQSWIFWEDKCAAKNDVEAIRQMLTKAKEVLP